MFVCYLDDSGKDRENPITTLAGYVAMEEAWRLKPIESSDINLCRRAALNLCGI